MSQVTIYLEEDTLAAAKTAAARAQMVRDVLRSLGQPIVTKNQEVLAV